MYSYHAPRRVNEDDIFDNILIHGDNLLALKALEQRGVAVDLVAGVRKAVARGSVNRRPTGVQTASVQNTAAGKAGADGKVQFVVAAKPYDSETEASIALAELLEKEIKTLDNLADLASDELVEMLGDLAPGREEADAISMSARAHWVEDETPPAAPARGALG